jgi:hypothetical protein
MPRSCGDMAIRASATSSPWSSECPPEWLEGPRVSGRSQRMDGRCHTTYGRWAIMSRLRLVRWCFSLPLQLRRPAPRCVCSRLATATMMPQCSACAPARGYRDSLRRPESQVWRLRQDAEARTSSVVALPAARSNDPSRCTMQAL